MEYPTEINGRNLTECLGGTLDYSTAMTSFTPFYSDIGLGIDQNSGIQCLFLHYNRRTTRCCEPFLAMPPAVSRHECTATGVTQFLKDSTVRIAFCNHNTWIVECEGVPRLDVAISQDPAFEEQRCARPREDIHIFDGYLPTLDKRDPDRRFPFVLGLRVIVGESNGSTGATGRVPIVADGKGRIVLAFSARVLAVEHRIILNRLAAASGSAEDAMRRTQAWLQRAVGSLKLAADDEHELAVLSRCVYVLLSNSAEAPGSLAGRISAFPSRGRYPTHFLWDSCFQNLAVELMHPRLAKDSLLLLTDNLRADGKMPGFLCSTWVCPDVSQPPLVGWAGLRLVRSPHDKDLAASLLPALQLNTKWWMSQRMTRFGLVFALGGRETGWDDSPRFDNGPTVACDINSYLLMQMRACAQFSRMLGDQDEAERQEAHADRYAKLIVDTLLDGSTGLFWDRHLASGEPVRIKTPACFLPMLAGVPITDAEMRQTIRNELLNPATFFGSVPFPSVAYDEECYQAEQWWRGPTWLPVAYLMLLLLDKAEFRKEAMSAREALYQVIIRDGNIRELFDSQTGEGLGAHEQGWTAAICLKLHQEMQALTGEVEPTVCGDD